MKRVGFLAMIVLAVGLTGACGKSKEDQAKEDMQKLQSGLSGMTDADFDAFSSWAFPRPWGFPIRIGSWPT